MTTLSECGWAGNLPVRHVLLEQPRISFEPPTASGPLPLKANDEPDISFETFPKQDIVRSVHGWIDPNDNNVSYWTVKTTIGSFIYKHQLCVCSHSPRDDLLPTSFAKNLVHGYYGSRIVRLYGLVDFELDGCRVRPRQLHVGTWEELHRRLVNKAREYYSS